MNPPDWSRCTEEEVWRFVAWHLEGAGIRSVLVGGAVVAIYTEGLYQSGDLDLVPDDLERKRLDGVLSGIGFHPWKGRYFKHADCDAFVLEFPKGPVELGEECPVTPEEIEWEGRTLRILSPTDCVKDRLAAFIHWGSRDCLDQAVLVCQRQAARVDFDNLEAWCRGENGLAAYRELRGKLDGGE